MYRRAVFVRRSRPIGRRRSSALASVEVLRERQGHPAE
jgi:hypothetical protein